MRESQQMFLIETQNNLNITSTLDELQRVKWNEISLSMMYRLMM